MIPATLAGLFAGVAHALSGPDHVAAVLPLAAEAPERGTTIGLSWAAGHGLGTLALVGAALIVRAELDLALLGSRAEALIGVVLVVTGAWTLLRARRAQRGHAHPGAALGIGTLHGVAGGTHVAVAIVALALPGLGALGWLLGFVLGAGLAMGMVGGLCRRLGGLASERWQRRARWLAGGLAIVVGAAWTLGQLLA